MTIDWSKAPEGAQWCTSCTWYKQDGSQLYYWCDYQRDWRTSAHYSIAAVQDTGAGVTPRPSEPKPYTRDEALQFLVERLDSWPTDIADAPLCPGWGWWYTCEDSVTFDNGSGGCICQAHWNAAHSDFVPFVSVEDAQPATAKQPAPSGKGDPILGMVLADLTNRALEGREKYGEALKANNGRNALWDAYQEALDLTMYLRQAIEDQSK